MFKENIKTEKESTHSKDLKEIFSEPEIISRVSIKYEIPEYEGRELHPGEKFKFVIPDEFRKKIIRDIILRHRKADKFCKDISPDGNDPHGAYSLVQVSLTDDGNLVGWNDPAGYNPIKFAEPRPPSDPENEVLHDWLGTVGKIYGEAVLVTNVGQDPNYSVSQIHGLEVVFFPDLEGVDFEEKIYVPGTSFIDIESNQFLPRYGGGEHTGGVYEHSVVLGSYSNSSFETTKDFREGTEKEGRRLLVNLNPNKELIQVEIAVGDTQHNKNGQSRLGWSKLWVGIQRSDNNMEWFIKNANIPPQGVISGAPIIEKAKIKNGDKLVIEARNDTAYLMGWRVAYK